MTDVELRFLVRLYNSMLTYYESSECQQATNLELENIVAEASCFYKILLDCKDEGYTYIDEVVAQTNALVRLQEFIGTGLARLGPPSEQERFYLYPEVIEVDGLANLQFTDEPCIELQAYLSQLDYQSDTPSEIAHCFKSLEQMRHWQAKTDIVMAEMADFLMWIIKRLQQQPEMVPVLLLRDTLLPYFGIKWLRQYGLAIPDPRPIFLSRKLTASFNDGKHDIYAMLSSNILFGILDEVSLCDLATLRQLFVRRASNIFTEEHPFVQSSRAYLKSLALTGPPLIIESGLHGTFPLWLLTLTNNVGDFVLYTTAPWLYRTYQEIVFRKNYNYLRDTETIVLHDCLFQFKTWHGEEILVTETHNSLVQSLAHYELHRFKQIVKQRMTELL